MEQNANTSSSPSRAELVPIPRTGLRGSSGILLLLALTLACTTVGISLCAMRTTSASEVRLAELLSAAASVLLSLHTFRISRRAKGIVPLLLVAAGFLAYYSDSLIPAGALVGLVTGIASGALLLTVISRRQAVYLPLVPLLAYGFTLLSSRDIAGSVAALLPLPAAAALAFATRRSAAREDGPNRVGVICLTSLALGASVAAVLALSLYRALGSLAPSVLTAALDELRESIILAFTSQELPPDTSEALRQFFSRENIEMLVNYTINLLPAILTVLVLLVSFVSQLLLHASLVSFGCGSSLSDHVRVFHMSAVSCGAFAVAYLVALIANGTSSTLAGTVAENIYTILVPGLAFAGLVRLLTGMAKRRMGCSSFLLVFLLPLALLLFPILLLVVAPILAIVEVAGRLGAFIIAKLRSAENDNSSQDPPTPPSDDDR